MHCIVVRRTTYERHPFIAGSLYRTFCEAKQIAIGHMRYIANPRYMLPWMLDDLDEIDAAAIRFRTASRRVVTTSRRSCSTWWNTALSGRRRRSTTSSQMWEIPF
jgi:hypothetical protein